MTAMIQDPAAATAIERAEKLLESLIASDAERWQQMDVRLARIEKGFEKMQEAQTKTEKGFEKLQKVVADASRTVGNLGSRQGEMVEAIVGGGLTEQFEKREFTFKMHSQDAKFKDKALGVQGEIDFILESGDTLLLVEVKTNLKDEHIQDHLERMEKFRRFVDVNWARKIERILGAVATLTLSEEVIKKAFSNGLYVIHVHSDNMTQLLTEPAGFSPRIV